MAQRNIRPLRQMLRLRQVREYEERGSVADAVDRLRVSHLRHSEAARIAETASDWRQSLLPGGGSVDASLYQQASLYQSHARLRLDEMQRQLVEHDDQYRQQTASWAKAKRATRATDGALQAALAEETRARRQYELLELADLWVAAKRGNKHER